MAVLMKNWYQKMDKINGWKMGYIRNSWHTIWTRKNIHLATNWLRLCLQLYCIVTMHHVITGLGVNKIWSAIPAGLEPAISWFVVRRLIHWATGPVLHYFFLKSIWVKTHNYNPKYIHSCENKTIKYFYVLFINMWKQFQVVHEKQKV